MYDIHTLQNQRKFENQSKIRNIRINGNVYEGTIDVVKAIQEEMEKEVKGFITNVDDASRSEEEFLNTVQKTDFTAEEIWNLNKPTTEEVYGILKDETNLDSAPGEDGITSRFLLTFWKMYSFRWMYMKYLNFTRFSDKYKGKNNTGVRVIKNKKSQSIDYEKKRKLTKINKDSNIGN